MKQLADKKRSDRSFEVGEWVYLKLHPYRQTPVAAISHQKLAAKYFGPYQACKKIGSAAYTLQLPATSKIHPTFHVSLLKKHIGPPPSTLDHSLPTTYDTMSFTQPRTPATVVEIRTVKKNNAAQVQWLVHWSGLEKEESTWEDAQQIMKNYPTFDP